MKSLKLATLLQLKYSPNMVLFKKVKLNVYYIQDSIIWRLLINEDS